MNNHSLIYLCENILSEREKKIFSMRFGIHCRMMDLDEIADEFDVSRERIKQIADKALLKIGEANLEIWDSIFQKARNGFLLKEGAHTFDSELDDLTMAKICHSIYKKQCAILCNKDLNHTWLIDYEAKRVFLKLIDFIKEQRRDSPVDIGIEQILSYFNLGDYSDFARMLLEDLVWFDKSSCTFPSFMPFEDRFNYLLEKFDGVMAIRETMDSFGINEDKACRLMRKGPCFRIGKTLCYDYHRDNLLIRLIKELDYEERPLGMDEGLDILGMKFGISKQEAMDTINSLVDSRPNIFTRIDNKIALTEWCVARKKHEKRLIDAIVEIIEESRRSVSSTEICKLLKQKYGESVSNNLNSLRMYLSQLYKMGEIGRVWAKNEYKYFLPKPLKNNKDKYR